MSRVDSRLFETLPDRAELHARLEITPKRKALVIPFAQDPRNATVREFCDHLLRDVAANLAVPPDILFTIERRDPWLRPSVPSVVNPHSAR